jgi:hypothetical protein
LFLRKQTENDKLPFARRTNGERIKKNRLDFRFPFKNSSRYMYIYICRYRSIDIDMIYIYIYVGIYMCICVSTYMLPFQHVNIRKTGVCFPCSANDILESSFAVSADVPIYTATELDVYTVYRFSLNVTDYHSIKKH